MSNADAKSGDGRASDGGCDRAMSRGGMSCDGAMSVGKASNGRTMTGGMMSGAATTTLGAVVASSDTTSLCAASNGRTMTGGETSGAAATTLGAEVASSDGTLSHNGPLSNGATSHGEASNGRIMTGGMTSGAATTIGAAAPLGGEHLAARERAAGARDAQAARSGADERRLLEDRPPRLCKCRRPRRLPDPVGQDLLGVAPGDVEPLLVRQAALVERRRPVADAAQGT
ncbi:hypothetical protein EMIHUDRAFT_197182 [Emiliania huxleyi CCMP1516]|uniref:Uncharacterized protein n=2 Tax=Emiliania huxleyi TaxID=2903 RepID=A0A0D3ITU6_EMIH1|nr:hypothetical protein EMIHUDRAFT_197182 [Emiliania huxleyi CCMP1516]EOD14681.1 hypothetical protein EMIHUDRAFT_197182 [Emiliania huxleyi CCMP1516]|eukprot:XP_005767110.1 hypothetical protein EMIHUDRAFT_197182 [Emiliania huxleyi CCMP1516]